MHSDGLGESEAVRRVDECVLAMRARLTRTGRYTHPVFWAGPRLCLGKDMARLETLSVAWQVLQRVHLAVQPHSELKVNGPVQVSPRVRRAMMAHSDVQYYAGPVPVVVVLGKRA